MSVRALCYITSDGTVYPCSNCSGSKVLAGGNLMERPFADIWNDDQWPIRAITWNNFLNKTCEGCSVNSQDFFCTGRCPGSSYALNGVLDGCGVSEFQRHSILRREELFRQEVNDHPRILAEQVKLEALQASPKTEPPNLDSLVPPV